MFYSEQSLNWPLELPRSVMPSLGSDVKLITMSFGRFTLISSLESNPTDRRQGLASDNLLNTSTGNGACINLRQRWAKKHHRGSMSAFSRPTVALRRCSSGSVLPLYGKYMTDTSVAARHLSYGIVTEVSSGLSRVWSRSCCYPPYKTLRYSIHANDA